MTRCDSFGLYKILACFRHQLLLFSRDNEDYVSCNKSEHVLRNTPSRNSDKEARLLNDILLKGLSHKVNFCLICRNIFHQFLYGVFTSTKILSSNTNVPLSCLREGQIFVECHNCQILQFADINITQNVNQGNLILLFRVYTFSRSLPKYSKDFNNILT